MKKQLFLFVVIFLVCLSLCSCGNTGFFSTGIITTTTSTFSDITSTFSTTSPTSTKPDDDYENTTYYMNNDIVKLGDTFQLDDFEIKVKSYKVKSKIPNGDHYAFFPDEGNKYLSVHITIKNIGESRRTFCKKYSDYGIEVYLQYKGKYTYYPSDLIAFDDSLFDCDLQPLSKKTGILAFQVPDEVAQGDGTLSLHFDDFISSNYSYDHKRITLRS